MPIGIYTRTKECNEAHSGGHHSAETRKKISIAGLKNPARFWLGKHLSLETKIKLSKNHRGGCKIQSEETKNKISQAKKGISLSIGHKQKLSEAHKGIPTWNKGKKIPQTSEEKSCFWKGDDVGYAGLHSWVKKHLGRPTTCQHCGKTGLTGKAIDWANKDHKYQRNLEDWLRLCKPCHREYDYKILNNEKL